MKSHSLLSMIFGGFAERYAKGRTLASLRELNDEQLADIGVSRALLNQGIAAYPWQMPEMSEYSAQTREADIIPFHKSAKAPAVQNDWLRAA